jgi:hypothetical protein
VNQYSVDVQYRANVNRAEKAHRHLSVSAPNRDVALLMAGHAIGLNQPGIVPYSVQVKVTRMRNPGSWS